MLSDNVEPSRNVTIGGSANERHFHILLVYFYFFINGHKLFYFHVIAAGDFISADCSIRRLQASFVLNSAVQKQKNIISIQRKRKNTNAASLKEVVFHRRR